MNSEEMDKKPEPVSGRILKDGSRVHASPMLDGRTRVTVVRADGSEETLKLMPFNPADAPFKHTAVPSSPRKKPEPPPASSVGFFSTILGTFLPGYAAMNTVLREWDTISMEIQEREAFARVSAAARPLLRRAKSKIAQELKKGLSPAHVALSALVNTAVDLLKSGSLSAQRGVLSPEGESVQRLAKALVWRMVSAGSFNHAEGAKKVQVIRDMVKEVG